MTDYLDLLPSWADRTRWLEHQLPVFQQIIDHFNAGMDLVLLDAPTGSGKTMFGDMTRRVLRPTRGVYICSSKTLMAQYMHSYPDAHPIMGRSNYIPTDVVETKWASITCADCTKNDTGSCEYCSDIEFCPYTLQRAALDWSESVCTNTAYFMSECMSHRSKLTGSEFVIADEADGLESEIMSHVSIEIPKRLRESLKIAPPSRKTVESAWVDWFDYAVPFLQDRRSLIKGRDLQAMRRRRSMDRLIQRLELIRADPEGYIYDGYERGDIVFKPVRSDKVAKDALMRHGKRWLHMSATFVSPEQHVQDIGWDKPYGVVFAPSTFDKSRRPIYFTPVVSMRGKAEVARVEAWPKMARGLEVLVDRHPDERILVHTHSSALTTFLLEEMDLGDRALYGYRNAAERAAAIAAYEENPSGVLLAMSLDRGYDGKDDLCRVVVICKLPFPYLGDKQVDARRRSPGGEMWYAVQTARSLQQMVGRGMRHEDDHCTIYIADEVFQSFRGNWVMKGPDKHVRPHRLFSNWFEEAVQIDGPVRFEVRQQIRQRERAEVSSGKSVVNR